MPAAGIAIALLANFRGDRLQKSNNALLKIANFADLKLTPVQVLQG